MLKLRPSILLYYTLPNFAFDATLKLIGIEIDLVYNQEMNEMIEAGLRGGMTQTTCKKVEASKKYVWEMTMIELKKVVMQILFRR